MPPNEELLLGVATSGYQIEGGFNGPGEPANNWSRWEAVGRVERSGIACDFWREPEVALDHAASLGCNAFRLSVEWARLEPAEGEFDDAALAHYASILDGCAERKMAPIVTLHHFTHPWWLGEEFWLTPGSPDRFADHVARVLPALAPRARHWITINEPNIVALMGWVAGASPPGRYGALADAWAVADNLLCAHVLAYRAVHRARPDALVTLNTSCSTLYDYDRLLTDLLVCRSEGVARGDLDSWVEERRARHEATVRSATGGAAVAERVLRTLAARLSPFGSPGRLRRPSPRRIVDVVYAGEDPVCLDASGLDWYDPVVGHAVRVPGHRSGEGRRWEPDRALWDLPTDPAAMVAWCADQARLVPDVPVWMVENGMATQVRGGRAIARLDGMDRPRYLRAHLGGSPMPSSGASRSPRISTGRSATTTSGAPTNRGSVSSASSEIAARATRSASGGSPPTPRAPTPRGSTAG